MTERQVGIVVGVAITVMGTGDFLRHQSSGSFATVLLVIEIVAMIVGVGSLLFWAHLREKGKTKL
jgi:hypothetical protein